MLFLPMLVLASLSAASVESRPTPSPASRRAPIPRPAATTAAPTDPVPPLSIDRGPGNLVEYGDPRAFGRFLTRWRAGPERPVVIAHFGDSHVQNGYQVGASRESLQRVRGIGGRGMVFPYAIARTYSQEDYSSSFTGSWRTANSIQQPPRLPIGVSGFAATTSDPAASATLTFTRPPARGALTVYVQVKADASYRLTLTADGVPQTKLISPRTVPQRLRFELASLASVLRLDFELVREEAAPAAGTAAPAPTFTLYGLDLRDAAPGGLVYHNLAVGGAAYNALLDQRLFESQFASLGADLVVLDWGTNDVLYTNSIAPTLADTVRRTIRRIRAADPEVAILISAPMDERFHRHDVTATGQLAELLRRIAFEENCLFYDWFAIAGGADAMRAWAAEGIASSDGIHLNRRGYALKGQIFAEALLRTIRLASGEHAAAMATRPGRANSVRAAPRSLEGTPPGEPGGRGYQAARPRPIRR
jgi:lysophospholipase L1-like esterase